MKLFSLFVHHHLIDSGNVNTKEHLQASCSKDASSCMSAAASCQGQECCCPILHCSGWDLQYLGAQTETRQKSRTYETKNFIQNMEFIQGTIF